MAYKIKKAITEGKLPPKLTKIYLGTEEQIKDHKGQMVDIQDIVDGLRNAIKGAKENQRISKSFMLRIFDTIIR